MGLEGWEQEEVENGLAETKNACGNLMEAQKFVSQFEIDTFSVIFHS